MTTSTPHTTLISGWGGYPVQQAQVISSSSLIGYKNHLQKQTPVIARGMGRSYGDSALAPTVLQTTHNDHFLEFNTVTGLLTLEAGVILRTILNVIVKQGWFLPVTPGTSFVTVGGAIASDVHGKNHHVSGTFGQHILSMSILLGTGEVVTTSRTQLPDLFYATCGGMGLTGLILSATIQLIPIKTAFINQVSFKTQSIEETCEAFDIHSGSTYSVAWIDCITIGKNLGRSVLMTGEHSDNGDLECEFKDPISIPMHTPGFLLNSLTMKAFNIAYWNKATNNKEKTTPLAPYFYPLDGIGAWNKLYGKTGFVQYQFVLPKIDGVSNMRTILTEISNSGSASFLAVLKKLGPENQNLLSFPFEGYTLALDFKLNTNVISLLHKFDNMLIGMGGRVYLAKDALISEKSFKLMYSKWHEFESVREKYGAVGKFASAQSKRLGLT
ncbi:MAG: hypothetical protein RJB34_1370 [Pseudomonadota bacterium]|jgi:FAD/FMN-containing dehydrogenase